MKYFLSIGSNIDAKKNLDFAYKELKNILVKQCELKDTINFLKTTHFKPQEAAKNDGKNRT